jgi:hypothetical protein
MSRIRRMLIQWVMPELTVPSTSVARAQRRQAVAMGPKARAATRMSGNELPQTADKRTSWVNWRPLMVCDYRLGWSLESYLIRLFRAIIDMFCDLQSARHWLFRPLAQVNHPPKFMIEPGETTRKTP